MHSLTFKFCPAQKASHRHSLLVSFVLASVVGVVRLIASRVIWGARAFERWLRGHVRGGHAGNEVIKAPNIIPLLKGLGTSMCAHRLTDR